MDEQKFFNYSLYVRNERQYHPNWHYVIFRSKFGKWCPRKIKEAGEPQKPTPDFLEWVDNHIIAWQENQS